jgi:hypothetical protein
VIALIKETRAKLREYFPDARIALEKEIDPESEVLRKTLWLYVYTTGDVYEAMEQLNQFDSDWWLDNGNRADGCLQVNLRWE